MIRFGAAACLIAIALVASGCEDSELPGENRSGQPVKLYFTGGEQFQPVQRDLKVTESNLEPTARRLVEGPTQKERSSDGAQTQIPEETELEGVDVSFGEATVKLSEEFVEGVPADPDRRTRDQAAELDARLGQLTYTLTQFDQVESVKVIAGGEVVAPNVEREDYVRPESEPELEPEPEVELEPTVTPLAAKGFVGRLQERLWQLGYLPGSAIDGENGYRTQQALTAFQAWEGLERDGVAGRATKVALREASRPTPRPGGPGKRIEVYRDKGVALLVKGGSTRRAVHISTGAAGTETPAGSFEVFRKELQSWSVPFSTWLPYASYFNNGIAFHEYPDVPPVPASHGCVRVSAPEAPFVYEFAAIGTTVRVF